MLQNSTVGALAWVLSSCSVPAVAVDVADSAVAPTQDASDESDQSGRESIDSGLIVEADTGSIEPIIEVAAGTLVLGDAEGRLGVIAQNRQRNWYVLEARPQTWVQILTTANPADDPNALDTVVRLYDQNRRLLLTNDDTIPRTNSDSELLVRLPGSGARQQYFVEVLDYADYRGRQARSGPQLQYRIAALGVTALRQGIVASTASGSTQALEGTNGVLLIDGDHPRATFSLEATTPYQLLEVFALDSLAAGAFVIDVDSSDAAGGAVARLVRSIDLSVSVEGLQVLPHLPSGRYTVSVRTPPSTTCALRYRLGADYPTESNENTNGTDAGAEHLLLSEARGGIVLFLGEQDVDVVGFDVAASGVTQVVCDGANRGSGIRGLQYSAFSQSHTVVADGTVDDSNSLRMMFPVSAGRWYLRFSKSGQEPAVIGNWLRCAVRTT